MAAVSPPKPIHGFSACELVLKDRSISPAPTTMTLMPVLGFVDGCSGAIVTTKKVKIGFREEIRV